MSCLPSYWLRTGEVALLVLLQRAGIKGEAFFESVEAFRFSKSNNLLVTIAGLHRTGCSGSIDPTRARTRTAHHRGGGKCSKQENMEDITQGTGNVGATTFLVNDAGG